MSALHRRSRGPLSSERFRSRLRAENGLINKCSLMHILSRFSEFSYGREVAGSPTPPQLATSARIVEVKRRNASGGTPGPPPIMFIARN